MAWLIMFFGTINIIRIGFFMIGADIYTVQEARMKKRLSRKRTALPTVSVIIPAHNEEATIIYSVQSVLESDYPKNKLEVIVMDDGSTDGTAELLRQYGTDHNATNLHVIHQTNAGKAHALNNAVLNYATGELIMCLDADTSVAPDAFREAANYFQDKRVVAMSSNVKIRTNNNVLNFIQRFEYLFAFQLKRALTTYNIEYIIGGAGSMFRRKALQEVGLYDTDTITEDIDLTMKLLQQGGKEWRVIYGSKVISYTESVLDVKSLIKQRYRWKFGRMQTFFKNRNLFFATNQKHNRLFTFWYLPFSLYSEFTFLVEPLLISYVFYVIIRYQDFVTLISVIVVMSAYMMMNVIMEHTIPWKLRWKLTLIAPSMYIFSYLLGFVEYVALIKTVWNLFTIPKSLQAADNRWEHVEREKVTV
jgi:poly-beta-1,6-N-acetyl-D-glucosamine synthase